MSKHVVAFPYPVLSHVISMMNLLKALSQHGFKITIATTALTQRQILLSDSGRDNILENAIHVVSLLDESGLSPEQVAETVAREMPGKLQKFIQDTNSSPENKISVIVADITLAWALEVARSQGIRRVAWHPASGLSLALRWSIPKLIDDGIIDNDGSPIKDEMVQLASEIPPLHPSDFLWTSAPNLEIQKAIFNILLHDQETIKSADWIISNSSSVLEQGAFNFAPEILPVGPITAYKELTSSSPKDSTCRKWLDQQPPNSVIYAAFGGTTTFNETRFQELAMGLEQTKRPFLWVVRPEHLDGGSYPDGFLERVSNRGLMVAWAPQREVLSHPSIGCFLTHCGWNSVLEAVSNGVPLLCWPYFADHFLNRSYICNVWQVGLELKGGNGISMASEIKKKVEQLLGSEIIKEKSLNLKELVVDSIQEGGGSYKNFVGLCDWIKSLEN